MPHAAVWRWAAWRATSACRRGLPAPIPVAVHARHRIKSFLERRRAVPASTRSSARKAALAAAARAAHDSIQAPGITPGTLLERQHPSGGRRRQAAAQHERRQLSQGPAPWRPACRASWTTCGRRCGPRSACTTSPGEKRGAAVRVACLRGRHHHCRPAVPLRPPDTRLPPLTTPAPQPRGGGPQQAGDRGGGAWLAAGAAARHGAARGRAGALHEEAARAAGREAPHLAHAGPGLQTRPTP